MRHETQYRMCDHKDSQSGKWTKVSGELWLYFTDDFIATTCRDVQVVSFNYMTVHSVRENTITSCATLLISGE